MPASLRVLRASVVCACLLALLSPLQGAISSPRAEFDGTWRLDPARSTNLAAWNSFQLKIGLSDTSVSIDRRLGWGRRVHQESMQLPLDATPTAVPVPYWADNRHLGAYIGGNRQKQVRARLIDGGRVLRTETDLTVETQQGDRAINILTDYHLSTDGQTLTVIEIRSTRARPVIYVFTRAES